MISIFRCGISILRGSSYFCNWLVIILISRVDWDSHINQRPTTPCYEPAAIRGIIFQAYGYLILSPWNWLVLCLHASVLFIFRFIILVSRPQQGTTRHVPFHPAVAAWLNLGDDLNFPKMDVYPLGSQTWQWKIPALFRCVSHQNRYLLKGCFNHVWGHRTVPQEWRFTSNE